MAETSQGKMEEPNSENVESVGHSRDESSLLTDKDDELTSGTGEERENEINHEAKEVKENESVGDRGKGMLEQECEHSKDVVKVKTDIKEVDNKICIEEKLEEKIESQADLQEEKGEEGELQKDEKQNLEHSNSTMKQLVDKENEDETDHELCSQQDENSCVDSDLNVDQEASQNLSDGEDKKSPVFRRWHAKSKKPGYLSSEDSTSREDERSVSPSNIDGTSSLISSSEESKMSIVPSTDEGESLNGPDSVEDMRSLSPSVENSIKSFGSNDEDSKRSVSPSNEEVKRSVSPSNEEVKRSVSPSNEEVKRSVSPSNEEVKRSVVPYSEENKMHVDPGSEECREQPDPSGQGGRGSEDPSSEERTSVVTSSEDTQEQSNVYTSSVIDSSECSNDKNNQPLENLEQECREQPDPSGQGGRESEDSSSEERTSVVISSEDTQEQSNVNTSTVIGSSECSNDKNNQPLENLEQDYQSLQKQEGVADDHTANSLQREEADSVAGKSIEQQSCVNNLSPAEQSQPEDGCKNVECIDLLSDHDEDLPVASQSATASKVKYPSVKTPETIIPTVCKDCQGIWNDKVLKTIFMGTESVTVNSRITYGSIICINNWAESHFGSEKENAVRGLLERADLGENIGSLKISEVNHWLGSLMKTGKIKCCNVFVAVYKENSADELLSSMIVSDLATAESPTDSKKRIAPETSEDGAPVTKKMVKELPETNPKIESSQIPSQAVKGNSSPLEKNPSSSLRFSSNSSNDSDSGSEKMLSDMWDVPLFSSKRMSPNMAEETCTPCSQTDNASTSKHASDKDHMLDTLETTPKQTSQFVSEKNKLSDLKKCKSLVSEETTSSTKTSLSLSKETSSPVYEEIVQLKKTKSFMAHNNTPSVCKTTSPSALEERSALSPMSSSQMAEEESLTDDTKEGLLLHQKKHQGLLSKEELLPSSTVSAKTTGISSCTSSGSSENISIDSSKSAVMSPFKSTMNVNKPLSPNTSSSSLDVHSEGTNSVSGKMEGAVPKVRNNRLSKSKRIKTLGASTRQKQPKTKDATDPSCRKLTRQISGTLHDSSRDSSPVHEADQLIVAADGQLMNLPAPCGLQVVPTVSIATGQLAFAQSSSGMVTTSASVSRSDSKMVPTIPDPVMDAPDTMMVNSVQQVPFGHCPTEPRQHPSDELLIEQQVSDKEQPQNPAKILESKFGEESASSDSDDKNKVSVQAEESSSVNLCMTLGLDVSTLDTYCSSTDVKTITNGDMAKNPSKRYKFSFSHYSMLKERSALSGFAREAFDLMPFESDNCRPLMPDNKGRERFLTYRELLTLQSICILNADAPDVDLFYRILVQILLTRNRVLLVPNSRTLLLVAEKLRRNFNRAKSKGAYAEFLSEDWDTSNIYTAEDLWLAKLEHPTEPTIRNILSVFCLWKNLEKHIPNLSLSEALHKLCRNINLGNTDNVGLCIKLYARFCGFLYEEKNNSLAEFFLNQPFIGSDTPTARKVLVDSMAAKFSVDMINLSSARSLSIAEKDVQGAVQKCLSAEKAVLHSPDARKEEDFRLSIATFKEKLNRYKEVNGSLLKRIKVAEKRKQEVLKRTTDSKSKKLIQELNKTLTAIHHELDKQKLDNSLEEIGNSRKALKLDNSTDVRCPTEVCLGEDVPQNVKEVIYELLASEVDVHQVRTVIHTVMNKVAEEEVPSLPSLAWIRNFARLNGFKIKSN